MSDYYISIPNDDYVVHHGVIGQKWGVRRYQNKDGSLTKAGKLQALDNRRARNANKTESDVDSIVSTLNKHDRYLLDMDDDETEWLRSDQRRWVVKRFIENVENKPVAFVDVLNEGENDKGNPNVAISIATRNDERNKGYGYKVAKRATENIIRNSDKYGTVTWRARAENVASQKLAEKLGYKLDEKKSDNNWRYYRL